MANYTVDEIIEKIKLYGAFPTNQPAFTVPNILKIINDQYNTTIVNRLISLNQEFFIDYTDTVISDLTMQDGVFIPSNAVSAKLREVKIVSSDGRLRNLARLDLATFRTNDVGFFIEKNRVKLNRYSDFTGQSLRLYYYQRPPELVLSTTCAQVTSFNTTTNEIYVGTLPVSLRSYANMDIIQGSPNFDLVDTITVYSYVGNILTTSVLPTGLAIGDWLCAPGTSCVPNIPYEAFEYFAQTVVVRIKEILGMADQIAASMQKLAGLEQTLVSSLANRVTGEPKKLVKRNSLMAR